MQDNFKENVVNNVNNLIMYLNSILYFYFFIVLVLEKIYV